MHLIDEQSADAGTRPPTRHTFSQNAVPAATPPRPLDLQGQSSPADDKEGYRRSIIAVAYWAAWVAFGVWSFRFLFAYRRNALWMVLAIFLLTQGDILPAYQVRRPLRYVALIFASLACAMLLYGTSDWWFAVFEGWHSSSGDFWVRQTLKRVGFPTLYILGTLLTAGMLVRPFKRTLGKLTVAVLATLGSFITIWVQSDLILSTAAWHHDWLVSALMLFRAIIVGLGTAAIAERCGSPSNPYAACPFWGRIWRGQIAVPWGITIYFISVLASVGLLVFFVFSYHTHRTDGSLQVGKQLIAVSVGEVFPCLAFLAGSLIALRTFEEAALSRRVCPAQSVSVGADAGAAGPWCSDAAGCLARIRPSHRRRGMWR